MGGWFVDIFVGYLITLFKMVARERKARRCKDWRVTTATIVGTSSQAEPFIPRPVAEIVYTYHLDGGFYGGVDEKPFYRESSAKDYASKFSKGDNLIVRVKPGEPEVSLVRDEDQTRSNESANSSGVSN
jgi:hypothetical protein